MHEKIVELQTLREALEKDISKADSPDSIEEVRVRYIGRKGSIADLFKQIGRVEPQIRGEFGKTLNSLKQFATAEIERKVKDLEQQETVAGVDPTLPPRPVAQGSYHPITLIEREVKRIFSRMGFAVMRGPEVEDVWHNFDALNTPEWHPSRDASDTLYLADVPDMLLRTETSPVQIRTMQAQKPPIRIVAPGRVFRNDKPDATHSPMFTQVEGLYVDKGVTFSDLKGTVLQFYRHLLGKNVVTRFRPHFFPFTEPSAEVDVSCPFCGGNGCRVCKQSGWIEVGGSGMVDPNVLETVGIDPEVYTGWAFGLGVERMTMLLYGVDDIRLFYENDIRFLQQFGGRR
ncbi:MAG TPA: phenylalanine--tRNA ligase subunit alpha [Bacteroidetes bacterium]|nr:phenylalanine--tRNA ligase subunit alpha [Bacteroidota bacterium]HEX03622.1 phenylalanine--tRNA ligase subunit alpha [Bacteroidota bacterium]